MQTQDGYHADDAAGREDADEEVLLAAGEVQILEDGHGEDQDGEVHEDVHGGVEEPGRKHVDAFAVLLGPEGADGDALEDAPDEGRQAVQDGDYE